MAQAYRQARQAQRNAPPPIKFDISTLRFVSHFFFLLTTFVYPLSSGQFLYKLGILGLFLGHSIQLCQSLSVDIQIPLLQRIISHMDFPYIMLSILLFASKHAPIYLISIPLFIGSLYQVRSFLSSDNQTVNSLYWKQHGHKWSETLVSIYPLVKLVQAHLELWCFVWTIGCLVVGKASLWMCLGYGQFLRMQLGASDEHKRAGKQWIRGLKWVVDHPSCPQQIKNWYSSSHDILTNSPIATHK
jgi:hypothetical protein